MKNLFKILNKLFSNVGAMMEKPLDETFHTFLSAELQLVYVLFCNSS